MMQPDRECELKIAIRPFEPEDAGAVSALIAVTMRESNARDYPPERLEALIAYFTPEKLRTLARERYCLVALAGGRLIGTAAREGDALATFFVDPESRAAAWGRTCWWHWNGKRATPASGRCASRRASPGPRSTRGAATSVPAPLSRPLRARTFASASTSAK